jgi:hypothetical protein
MSCVAVVFPSTRRWLRKPLGAYMRKRDYLSEYNENMIFADGFDNAIIGYVERFGTEIIALYSRPACIDILVERDGMTHEEAEEFFEFNVIGAWVGDCTPAFATITETHLTKRALDGAKSAPKNRSISGKRSTASRRK